MEELYVFLLQCKFPAVSVVAWWRMAPIGSCLNKRSPTVGTIWEGLGRVAVLEVSRWGRLWGPSLFCCLRIRSERSAPAPAPYLLPCSSPWSSWTCLSNWTSPQLNAFFYQLPWLWCIFPVVRKQLKQVSILSVLLYTLIHSILNKIRKIFRLLKSIFFLL